MFTVVVWLYIFRYEKRTANAGPDAFGDLSYLCQRNICISELLALLTEAVRD